METDYAAQQGPIIFADLLAAARDPGLAWEPFREGIEICRIYDVPGGPSAAFLRYAPGASLARHEHRGFEHVFVLTGSQVDDSGRHEAGAMLVHPPGSSHAVTTSTGCVVLAVWEKPVAFVPPEGGEATSACNGKPLAGATKLARTVRGESKR
jgi:hypothetical protein